MTSRRKNEIDPRDVVKILRGHLPNGEKDLQPKSTDLDDFCDVHRELMVDLLGATARPTSKLVQDGMKLAFPEIQHGAIFLFATQIAAAYSHCTSKEKSMTSGAKLRPSVKEIIRVIRKVRPEAPGKASVAQKLVSSLKEKSKRLQRSVSDESSKMQKLEIADDLQQVEELSQSSQSQPAVRRLPTPPSTLDIAKLYNRSSGSSSSTSRPVESFEVVSSQEAQQDSEQKGIKKHLEYYEGNVLARALDRFLCFLIWLDL